MHPWKPRSRWSGQEELARAKAEQTKSVNISFLSDPTICPWVSEDASSIP